MHSRASAAAFSWSLALAIALGAASAPARAAEPVPPAMTVEQVRAAAAAVREDPLLGGKKTERTLRMKPDTSERPKEPPKKSADAGWFVDFLRWMSESARILVWVLGAIAVALVLVFIRRWIAEHGDFASGRSVALPSHVRDLDIRPESLPDDIAGEARSLWRAGQHRAALSLLYRGALSRLVHHHGVAIRAASTEGDCVDLARRAISEPSADYFRRLVGAWLLSVYGGRSADDATVMALCDQFDARLPVREPQPEHHDEPEGAAA